MQASSKNRHVAAKKFEIPDVLYAVMGFFGILIPLLFFQQEKLGKLKNLFKKKTWVFGFISILIWSSYVIINDRGVRDKKAIRRYTATQHAIVAFLIAMFAYVDLTISPFWTIWIVTYFLGDLD